MSCSSTGMMRMLAPWLSSSSRVSSTASFDPQSQRTTLRLYIDLAEGPNIGWTEQIFLLRPSSLTVSRKGDLRDAMSKIRVSGPQIVSSFLSMSSVREMGIDTMTTSAHFASSTVSPLPAEGSIMSTRWPDLASISDIQRPIFPYPPMIATCLVLAAGLGSDAWTSIDSCMSILQMLSA